MNASRKETDAPSGNKEYFLNIGCLIKILISVKSMGYNIKTIQSSLLGRLFDEILNTVSS